MVTTRAATGSLPAKPVRVIETAKTKTKKARRVKQIDKSHDPKANVGEDDKFSTLPLEILVEIFSRCHPKSLLHLARTNRTIRAYLASKKSKPVWQAARMGMEYWAGFGDSPKPLNVIRTLYDSFVDDDDTDVGEHDDYESGYEIFTQEWNSKAPLTLLDPSPFWSELVRALWAGDGEPIDERFWNILPGGCLPGGHGQTARIQLPQCEELRDELFHFEARVHGDASEIDEWFSEKTQVEIERNAKFDVLALWTETYEKVFTIMAEGARQANRQTFVSLCLLLQIAAKLTVTLIDSIIESIIERGYAAEDVDNVLRYIKIPVSSRTDPDNLKQRAWTKQRHGRVFRLARRPRKTFTKSIKICLTSTSNIARPMNFTFRSHIDAPVSKNES
ncbi:hypothetical protein EMMF5_001779 [Cystobasidiomycetes sp. EMM_F5]